MNCNKRVFKQQNVVAVRSSAHEQIPPNTLQMDMTINIGGSPRYSCRALHTGRKVFFQPSWDVPISSCVRRADHTNEYDLWHPRNLKTGVTVLPDNQGPAFSYAFLTAEDNPAATPGYPEVLEYLERIGKLNKKQFKSLLGGRKPPVHFTEAEDAAIVQYYRPDRTPEDVRKLYTACLTRTPTAISNRARYLRKKLIQKGVYAIEKLPHGQYNATIAKEIAAARKLYHDEED